MLNSQTASPHLRGPWVAILADLDGWVFESFGAALAELGEEHDEEMRIRVVRGTALPAEVVDPEHDVPCLPGSYRTGDVALDLDDVWLVDPDDASVGAEARYIQAQAMAAGLNAAAAEHRAAGHVVPQWLDQRLRDEWDQVAGDTAPSLPPGEHVNRVHELNPPDTAWIKGVEVRDTGTKSRS